MLLTLPLEQPPYLKLIFLSSPDTLKFRPIEMPHDSPPSKESFDCSFCQLNSSASSTTPQPLSPSLALPAYPKSPHFPPLVCQVPPLCPTMAEPLSSSYPKPSSGELFRKGVDVEETPPKPPVFRASSVDSYVPPPPAPSVHKEPAIRFSGTSNKTSSSASSVAPLSRAESEAVFSRVEYVSV